MKRLVSVAVLVSASSIAFAAGGHGPAGCGLGSQVFKDADEWHEHVLAATTNGTSGNQTFGMTSGTLGCESANGPLKLGVSDYVDTNLEQLAVDISRGQGETVEGLADLIGIEQADKALFVSALQANFDVLFHSADTVSSEVYGHIVSVMSAHSELEKYLS